MSNAAPKRRARQDAAARPAGGHLPVDDAAAMLQALLEHGPCHILAVDARGRIRSLNRAPDGLRVADAIGISCLALVRAEDRAAVRHALAGVRRTGAATSFQVQAWGPSSPLGWFAVRALPMHPGSGTGQVLMVAEDIGAHRQAEEALRRTVHELRESDERLRLALEASGEGLWDWNLVTDAVHYSPAFFTMLGHRPEDMPAHLASTLALLLPDQRDEPLARVRRLLDDPGHFSIRFRMRSAGGEYRWIESRGKTVRRDAKGRPLRAVGTHVDVTDHTQLADALGRSEARLRAIVDSTSDLVHVKDPDGRYVLVNKALCTFAGLAPAEILGRDDTAFLPAETARAVMEQDRRVMAGGVPVTLELSVTTAAGEPRTLHATKGPLCDETGQVVGVFGIARDLTDRLRQEEDHRLALAQSRELLDQALAGSDTGTWDHDLVTGRAWRDARYLAIIGRTEGELQPTAQAWESLIHPDDRESVRAAIRAHERGDTRRVEIEYRLQHKDGHWVWLLGRGRMWRDASGRPVRASGTVQDLSQRRRVASEGAVLLRQLEGLIGSLGARAAADAAMPGRASAPPAAAPVLSRRHREVLALVAEGLTAAQIAQRLGISRDTADTHRRNLMRTLGLRNKAELIRFAIAHGLGGPRPDPPRR